MQKKTHIKKGDMVKVLAGEDRSKEGRVLDVDRDRMVAFVEGLNINKKHSKPTTANPQGGIVEKEFQTEYVSDRTNTFGDALIGMTLGCAKCHDHKYDPISQKNYYEIFSFFNNVREAGQISWDNAMPTPTLMLPT